MIHAQERETEPVQLMRGEYERAMPAVSVGQLKFIERGADSKGHSVHCIKKAFRTKRLPNARRFYKPKRNLFLKKN
jgi:hypothetical protein